MPSLDQSRIFFQRALTATSIVAVANYGYQIQLAITRNWEFNQLTNKLNYDFASALALSITLIIIASFTLTAGIYYVYQERRTKVEHILTVASLRGERMVMGTLSIFWIAIWIVLCRQLLHPAGYGTLAGKYSSQVTNHIAELTTRAKWGLGSELAVGFIPACSSGFLFSSAWSMLRGAVKSEVYQSQTEMINTAASDRV